MTATPETTRFNAAEALIRPNLLANRGAKPAFIDPERTLTYAELDRQTNQMANLLATYAIPREARIALLLLDTVDFPVAFLGAIKAGVVPVALNTLMTAEQYAYLLEDCRAQVLIVSAPLLAQIEPILSRLTHVRYIFVSGGAPARFALSFADELAVQDTAAVAVDTHCDETAFWLYSSGSTGNPKGTRHIHTSMHDTARLYAQGVLGLHADDVVYSAAKLFFAYGLGNGLSFPLSVGATAILRPDRPTPESVLATMKAHQPTVFYGVPTLYAALLAHPDATPANASARLRLCTSAGEALPADVGKAWRDRFGVDILDGIGSTEMLHIFVSNRPGDIAYGTTGRAVPGYDIRIVDDAGADVPDGEIGEMVIKGPSAADGYWNQRERSRRTFAGEWTRSGDKYVRDAEGRYTYQGRTDDMFKVSGIWVSPFEVESALISHDAVFEAAVVPSDDGDGLIKPKAFVVLKAGLAGSSALVEELQAHVKSKAGPWKYPRWIEFKDALPKTATGKIQRFKLRSATQPQKA
jgi:4-hydroxybenzoate-CoA ligase